MTAGTDRAPTATWRGPLRDLLAHLTAQLAATDRPKVKLPRGAFLSLSRRPNGQRVLRIARDTKPVGEKAEAKWLIECRTFQREMGLHGWAFAPQLPVAGVAAAFVEPSQEELFR